MTMPRNLDSSCSAGSQVPGAASSYSDYAWNVNFNNGESNLNNQNNRAFVRLVRRARASEYRGAGAEVSFRDLYDAWENARRKKVPSDNQMAFESRLIDGLFQLQERINRGTWSPSPTTCFVAKRPKAREIHAPDFSDRVVHHWLVPILDAMFEPRFIFDSYANRAFAAAKAAAHPRTREQREHRRSVLASYAGHFAHANAHRLTQALASGAQ